MFLGIDLGTSSVKVMVVDAAGRSLITTTASYPVDAPHARWGETHPDHWWRGVGQAIAELPPALRRAIRAIGYSGQMHGIVLCDASGAPLHPAILWLDKRGTDYLSRFPNDAYRRLGNRPSAGMASTSLLWLKDHAADTYTRARWALQPKDWLRLKMSGEAMSEPSDASGSLLASADGAWERKLVAELGLRDELLPPIVDSHAIAGVLRSDIATQLDLPGGTPMVAGAADTAAAAFGNGLLRHGEAQLTTGTGGQIIVMRDAIPDYSPNLNIFRSANPAGYAPWYAMAAMLNVGMPLEWARRVLGFEWDRAYQEVNDAKASSTVFLPYLFGERTPLMDPNLRGAWIGLSDQDDRSTMMRAVFEGVAFSLRAGLDALESSGEKLNDLRFSGGGSTHPWWRQLLADVLGKELRASATVNASERGAALLAGLGIGHWSKEALPGLVMPVTVTASPRADDGLMRRYERFTQASRSATFRSA